MYLLDTNALLYDILPIKLFHLDEIGRLPAIHGDPFG